MKKITGLLLLFTLWSSLTVLAACNGSTVQYVSPETEDVVLPPATNVGGIVDGTYIVTAATLNTGTNEYTFNLKGVPTSITIPMQNLVWGRARGSKQTLTVFGGTYKFNIHPGTRITWMQANYQPVYWSPYSSSLDSSGPSFYIAPPPRANVTNVNVYTGGTTGRNYSQVRETVSKRYGKTYQLPAAPKVRDRSAIRTTGYNVSSSDSNTSINKTDSRRGKSTYNSSSYSNRKSSSPSTGFSNRGGGGGRSVSTSRSRR
jgi:hypothetical protein